MDPTSATGCSKSTIVLFDDGDINLVKGCSDAKAVMDTVESLTVEDPGATVMAEDLHYTEGDFNLVRGCQDLGAN